MESILGIPPQHLLFRQRAAAEAYRVSLRYCHRNIVFLELYDTVKSVFAGDKIFSMNSGNRLKEYSFMKPFKVIFPKREDWYDEERRNKLFTLEGFILYTDVSKELLDSGAGEFEMKPSAAITIALSKFPTSFEAKIVAIKAGLEEIHKHGLVNHHM